MTDVGTIVGLMKDKGTKNVAVEVKFSNLNLVEATTVVAVEVMELAKVSGIPADKVVELVQEGIKKGK